VAIPHGIQKVAVRFFLPVGPIEGQHFEENVDRRSVFQEIREEICAGRLRPLFSFRRAGKARTTGGVVFGRVG
jgi:hypothetical protein